MKLSEALAARADAQTRLAELRTRISGSARHQEGEPPAEDPNALVEEAERTVTALTALVRRINRTNAATAMGDGAATITDAIAERDALASRRKILADAANAAQDSGHLRLMRSEIRMVSPLDVAALRRRVDDLAREHRRLDLRIQEANWATELLD